MEKERNNKPTLKEAVLGFIITMGVIVLGLRMKAGMEMPLMLGAITAAMVSLYLGNKWNDIQDSIVDGIANTAVTNIILIFSGILVGVWILGGAVPTLIYYGIQLISPKFFLPITFLLACLTSVATGTSFGTIATIGVGSLGIGTGLGIPTAMTIGAVVSGSFFGDKMSPISDTTNIAPAMAGGDLFEHIGSMLWTTIPAAIVAAVAYTFLGLKHSGGNIDYELINQISATLDNNFNISLLTLLPFVLLLILSIKKEAMPHSTPLPPFMGVF
jgi:NhaC family Na+:H+ antiporter